ncbi:MAG: hypothetical protein H0W72_04210 [Planctomycetes bacterium]|nr:hypothetical protein [Planctomycetota bacterium]
MTTTRKIKKSTPRQVKTVDRLTEERLSRALECLRRAAGIGRRAIA